MASFTDIVNQLEADATEAFQNEHGTLEGCAAHLASKRPAMLLEARRLQAANNADEPPASGDKGEPSKPRRSEMTVAEKGRFIRANGAAAYRALPE
jgi:hypothetical protein